MQEDHKATILEYAGLEGADFKDFVLTKIMVPQNNGILYANEDKRNWPIKLYLEVVGLQDGLAPNRNWGKRI